MRITPEYITELKPNEIFVFGSNEAGIHGAGAARLALKWGAEYGVGVGKQGDTYAIPTKDKRIQTLPLHEIAYYMLGFRYYVAMHPNQTFLVTAIGCGLAGYTPKDIAPLLKGIGDYENVYLPQSFWEILN